MAEKNLADEEYKLQEQMKSNKKKVERYQLLQNQIQKIQEQIATKREERGKNIWSDCSFKSRDRYGKQTV